MTEETLFEIALKTPPAERAVLLERACEGKPELRARVERLLAAQERAGGVLSRPPAWLEATGAEPQRDEAPSTMERPTRPDDGVGQTVGPYKLMQKLGEGGMGTVWVAEQSQPVKRRVALKLIKAGMDSALIVGRFEAERQALALMDHTCIAKVFDAGTTPDGRPFFVMELVKGVPITKYCDEVHLSIPDRLDLFVQLCSAVQHAHQKGIIHRDLKPSNVLIAMQEGKPIPKVIDFGVAKALHQKLAEQTMYTEIGQVIGTLEYMAPEQAELSAMDIDTRADVYALGVLLYELLAGSTPITRQRLKSAGFAEILRVIKEEEPAKPSTRLSESRDALANLAAQRRTDPRKLAHELKGELDWVVMKALEKDRTRRYETASGFSRDIQRYLADEPVEARPASAGYRLRKFVRRNRGLVLAATVLLLSLAGGAVGTTWGLIRAVQAEKAALAARDLEAEQRKEADKSRQEAEQSQQKAERYLVGSYLRPIGYQASEFDFDAAELKSLAEWSANEDARLKLLGLEAAFENPETALRIARRAERVLQACVGISPTRRTKAMEILVRRQNDRTTDPRLRVAACWLAIGLGSADLPALKESLEYLSSPNENREDDFARFAEFAAARTDPAQNEKIDPTLTDRLISVLENAKDTQLTRAAGTSLSALALRLNSAASSRAASVAIGLLSRTDDAEDIKAAGVVLGALVPRLDQLTIAKSADCFTAILRKTTKYEIIKAAANALAVLAVRLDSLNSASTVDALISILKNSTNRVYWYSIDRAIAALGKHLDQTAAKRAALALIGVLATSRKGVSYSTISAIDVLVPQLDLAEAATAANGLIDVLRKTMVTNAIVCIGSLAPRLDPAMSAMAAETLIGVLSAATDEDTVFDVGSAIGKLAPRLNSSMSAQAADVFIAHLRSSVDSEVTNSIGEALERLAPQLDAVAAARIANALIVAAPKNASPFDHNIGDAIKAIAPRFDRPTAVSVANAMIGVLDKTTDDWATYVAGPALPALASQLDAETAAKAFDAFIGVLAKAKNDDVILCAEVALGALSKRIEPASAKSKFVAAADVLVDVLSRTQDKRAIEAAGEGFAAFMPQLPPAAAEALLARVANTLLKVLSEPISGEAFVADLAVFCKLARLQNFRSRDQVIDRAFWILLDYHAIKGYWALNNYLPYPRLSATRLAMLVNNPKAVAQALSHPGCVYHVRTALLSRFEELTIHAGKPLPQPQAFYSLHDAAAWIEKNMPDVDLEKTCPVQRR